MRVLFGSSPTRHGAGQARPSPQRGEGTGDSPPKLVKFLSPFQELVLSLAKEEGGEVDIRERN